MFKKKNTKKSNLIQEDTLQDSEDHDYNLQLTTNTRKKLKQSTLPDSLKSVTLSRIDQEMAELKYKSNPSLLQNLHS